MIASSGMSYWDAFLPSIVLLLVAFAVLPWLNRDSTIARTGVIAVCIFLAWRYMLWRVLHTLPPVGLTLDFALGVIFTSVEFLSMVGVTLSLFFLTRTRNRTAEADRNIAWLKSLPEPPLVDVLICTYNEEELILDRTIIGALGIDYPNFRLWVCDDGRRPWLKDMCEQQGCGYITRTDNKNAKAGNINNALRHISTLSERPDFVAILDADFVPKSQWLTRALALMREPDVGVVQTPQHFFNADPIQKNLSLSRVWPDEQRYFFDVVMASKDAWGGAICCGTSAVLRFAPLMQIKKFPTDSVTEDYLITLRLNEIGYRTVYLNEPLSLGLAPEGLKEYISQRSRWALGFMQICRGPNGPFSLTSHASLSTRVMLIETFLYWSATHAFRILAIVVPAAYLWFNIQAVYAYVPDAISYLLPVLVAGTYVMIWLTHRRVLPILADLSQLLIATDIAKSVLVGLFRPQGHKFEVTAKGGDRTKRFLQWPMLRIFIFCLVMTVGGVIWAFVLDDSRPVADATGIALFWSWYNIILLVLACFVCIEAPEIRAGVRFHSEGEATLTIGGRKVRYAVADISVGGMRFKGDLPPKTQEASMRVEFDGLDVEARLVRAYKGGFAVQFVHSENARERLIRLVYGGKHGGKAIEIKPAEVMGAMINRVFR